MPLYHVTAHYNTRREAMRDGYSPADPVEKLDTLIVSADSVKDVASIIFENYNIGGAQGSRRSMSVGDVIEVEDKDSRTYWLSVEGTGFDLLEHAPVALVRH